MYKNLIEKLKEYNSIVIFRHARPDGDAVFSQFAMYQFLLDNFRDKSIYMYSHDTYDILPYRNIVPKKVLKESLAIVLDTANTKRIDGNDAYLNCKYIIKIDHHPITDNYGNINIVDDKAAAVSEILATILLGKEFSKYILSEKTCCYLYSGIISDSKNFTISSTTCNTLLIASKLVEKAKLDISAISNFVFNENISEFKKSTEVRKLLKVNKGVGYIIASNKTLENLHMSSDEIKNRIDEFDSINNLKIWCIFAYNKKTKLYDASLRSRRKYVINEVAKEYNGGGHKNASGIKGITRSDIKVIVTKLVEIASN